MRLFVRARSFLRNLFLSRRVDVDLDLDLDLDQEVHSHLVRATLWCVRIAICSNWPAALFNEISTYEHNLPAICIER